MVDIGGLIDRLAPLIEEMVQEECSLWINSKTEAEILLSNLKEIQNVIEEAENRRLADPRVRTWLEKLRDLTYEIDDALDDWETINCRLQIHDNNWWKKINIFVHPFRSCVNYISRDRGVALHIKELNIGVDSLAKETAKYSMLPISSDSQDISSYGITTFFSDLMEIPNQEIYKDWLVDEFLSTEGEEQDLIKVISLVGTAGIGKTTVAQLAFKDERVQSKFDLKLWTCAFQMSDMIRLTKAILQSLHVSYREDAELLTLLELIESSVSGKTFLLVLDHVWKEDDSAWSQLKASLRSGALESRILVTTRNNNVAELMGSTTIIELQQLSDEDCWLLLRENAFRGKSEVDKDRLGGIGQRIAKKCMGLPHAAKTLGNYLQPIRSKELWVDVLEKELWQLDEVAENLFAPLTISYNELPLALKRCFLYCAVYPKDFWIDADELISLWILEGYLSSSTADAGKELKGRKYLEKLVSRYFFHSVMLDDLGENIKKCKMHPFLLNFARYLVKTGSGARGLRSFCGGVQDCLRSIKQGSLKSVRALYVRESETQDLPEAIGKLIDLRGIILASNSIKQLPVAICDLYNLCYLYLIDCTKLSELPKQIHKLKNLRHLLVNKSGIQRLPRGLRKLTNLQTLDVFYVGREASKFEYLDKLDQLRGSMYIYLFDLKEKEDVKDAKKAHLSNKFYLRDLRLFFRGNVSIDVLDHLQVPPNLQQFHMSDYKGTQFPSWINASLNTLTVLEFEACHECLELPPVGKLPFLEKFIVRGMKSLKRVGHELWGDPSHHVIFPKLKNLYFGGCDSWEEWEDITEDRANTLSIMPLLETLTISECYKLKALPKLILQQAADLKLLAIDQNCPDLLEQCKSIVQNLWQPVQILTI